jgi:hypothetical protein
VKPCCNVRLLSRAGLVVVFLIFQVTFAWARDSTIPDSRYLDGRAAALGHAFLPLGDDGAAGLFYNPAILAKLKRIHFETTNVQLQANDHYVNMLGTDSLKIVSLPSNRIVLAEEDNLGRFPHMSFGVLPNLFYRGIAAGIFLSNSYQSRILAGYLRYRAKFTLIPAAGVGLRLANGIIRLGYSFQIVSESSGDVTKGIDESVDGYTDFLNQGMAFSHTVGFALTLPIWLLPQFNVVLRNLGGASFRPISMYPVASSPLGTPDTELMSVDASFSVQPKFTPAGFINWVAQVRDITNTSEYSILRRFGTGLEFAFRNEFFLRFGYGGRYPSAGLGLKREFAEVSLSWFSEEIGSAGNPERDIRWMVHYKLRTF